MVPPFHTGDALLGAKSREVDHPQTPVRIGTARHCRHQLSARRSTPPAQWMVTWPRRPPSASSIRPSCFCAGSVFAVEGHACITRKGGAREPIEQESVRSDPMNEGRELCEVGKTPPRLPASEECSRDGDDLALASLLDRRWSSVEDKRCTLYGLLHRSSAQA